MSVLQIIDRPSPNFDARTRPIDLVVLHYTGMQNAEIALARLTDDTPTAGEFPGPWQRPDVLKDAPLPRVSAHYVVDEAGAVYRLVPEEHRAWHAGAASWEGEGDVNSRAVGIEIVNGGHDFGLPDFPDEQVASVIELTRQILKRWDLKPHRVVAHSDIAPERKSDPGEKFPWKRLADAGVSIWPKALVHADIADSDPVIRAQERLAKLGYAVKATGSLDPQTRYVVMAFQRRFRPSSITGQIDDETQAILAALSLQMPRY
ncbi:N-acetylmuramoyl-L-alanine amidase [Terricaulis sp.]|uniref:N-acetylmuramoyl-L-alanine amidase n=1 Tax=Terricaulis sp. TaxID=2768686 RepID=UPI003783251F